MRKLPVFLAELLCVLVFLPGVANAQLPERTVAQARQELLRYVVAPDTTLSRTASVDADGLTGHREYRFVGDSPGGAGGWYTIDAVTGEKIVQFARAPVPPANPGPPLSVEDLTRIARAYAAGHFPGYHVRGLETHAPKALRSGRDGDLFFVGFGVPASSGADLPVWCIISVDEGTGALQEYHEEFVPVHIETTPAVNEARAVAAGREWILDNISASPGETDFMSVRWNPIRLKVMVDPLLRQTLVYEIPYYAASLTVDARSRAVIGWSPWLMDDTKGVLAPRKSALAREGFTDILASAQARESLTYMNVFANGQLYMWGAYLPNPLGIVCSRHGDHLKLRRGAKVVSLGISKRPEGSADTAWDRDGVIYVPVPAVRKLWDKIVVDPYTSTVVLNVPGYKPVPGVPNELWPHAGRRKGPLD